MNRGKAQSLWSHVQSTFTRQQYRQQYSGIPNDGRRDHDEHTALEMQPSTFSLASFSSKIQKPRASILKSNLESTQETYTLIHQTDVRQTIIDAIEDGGSTSSLVENTWIVGVRYCATAGTCILIINLVITLVAAGIATQNDENTAWGNSAVIYEGDCGLVKRWSLGLHLIINILSTLILASSNYCMQTLVAPTREEVDTAHARGEWLDIGGASIKNLLAIGRHRLGLWIILILTASPFHLMYNSMVFESLSTNEFGYFVAPKDTNFSNVHSLTTPALEKCFHSSSDFNLTWDEAVSGIESKNYDRLDFDACSSFVSPHMGIKAVVMLADNLTVSDGGNASVLAVNSPIVNNSVFAGRFAFESAGVGPSIQCMDEMILHMEVDDRLTNFIGYNYNYTVNECLVLKARGHCQLLYSPPICIAIALTAFVKVSAMFLAARVGRNRSPPLLTTSAGCQANMSAKGPGLEHAERIPLLSTIRSQNRNSGYEHLDGDKISSQFEHLFSSNYGGTDIPGVNGMLQSVVFVNIPQLVVTMCYYCYNAVLTSMLAAAEYSSYGTERKALRVTWPIKSSQQRSTYWLSIPYRYSVPILLLYMTLHWTISQSIFYTETTIYTPQDEEVWRYSGFGFSAAFILFSVLVGAIMILALCILGLRRLKSNAPLSGSCSAAISAACHPPTHENLDAAIRSELMWGETISLAVGSIDSEGNEPEKGHCSFTSLGTVKPTLTKLYA
ncbi:hypothetical protein HAV15_000576 [Penicillium sp. str. |nr:hypothetical protein HAV15_000576 [Penicillium sp. str. \